MGAFLLATLEPDWRDYVAFHLNTVGCRFCRANLEDLEEKMAAMAHEQLPDRILQSTVGFLSRT